MATIGEHALVLGAGLGGLLAARVLSDAYEQVTLVDRDRLPADPRLRRGVPQGGQGHILQPRGGQIIGHLFPGILDEMETSGVPVIRDELDEFYFSAAGHVLRLHHKPARPLVTYIPSRPYLEWQIRKRVTALPNVRIGEGYDVGDPITDARERVTGVHFRDADATPGTLTADLVVDAMGRGAHTPAWLERLGYGRPPEDKVAVDVTYATHRVRMAAGVLREKLVIVAPVPDRPTGLGLFRHEDDYWDFTVFGVGGQRPPRDPAEMIRFIEEFTPPHVVAALRNAESLADVAVHRFPTSRRRRYERMRRLPDGLIAFGDAICSFNPTYGQGMTVAAMEALALAHCLRDGVRELPRRFYSTAAAQIDPAWRFAAIADRPLLGKAAVPLAPKDRLAYAISGQYLRAAEDDSALAEQFLRVLGLLDRPERLLSPSLPSRVARARLRRAPLLEPPPIPGVRRSFVHARGVRFHVTEAGSGAPVLLLHGWPQHHYAYRHLLADPPPGLRIIAPDLPGYGWSGPPPHRWGKEDVASDVLSLINALGLDRVLLVGHDWGGWIGHLLVLRAPERFDAFVPLNIAHPWQTPQTLLPHLWRFLAYQPPIAAAGMPLHRHTSFVERVILGTGVSGHPEFGPEVIRAYAERFRDPVCARAATDTYRTFWLRELPRQARHPERRRAIVPIRAIFGVDDFAIHHELAAAETANADDYTLEYVAGCGHFIAEERPDLVRARIVELAAVAAPLVS